MTEQFIYVTYIRTTPEKLWQALTDPAFTREYWWGTTLESDWKKGSPWAMKFADGRLNTSGTVLESDPPRRMVLDWHNEYRPELIGDGPSRATFEIEPAGELVKLTVTHQAQPKLLESVSGGWPKVLASLKSYLETGRALEQIMGCAAAEERAA
jgi:uncharacterized protein YndB with AHSA1/START domain